MGVTRTTHTCPHACIKCIRINTECRGITCIIIHQTHNEKSDWSRAFNQFTIACQLDMINAISAADIAFNEYFIQTKVYFCILKFLNDLG